LKLPLISFGFGYKYLDRGEFPIDLQQEDLVHVGEK
jgi:hypothetical protein